MNIRPNYRDNPQAWVHTPRQMTNHAAYGYAGSYFKRQHTPMSIALWVLTVLLIVTTVWMSLS